MKLPYRFSIVASLCGLLLLPGIFSYSFAQKIDDERANPTATTTQLSPEALRQQATAITVKIYAGEARGSGVLIAKDGRRYTVITNAHVIDRGAPYRIQTHDGKIHSAQLINKGNSYNGNDLATLTFESDGNYAIAALGDSTILTQNETVYAAGFPFEDEKFTFNSGNIALIVDKPLVGGYQIGFTNETRQGMSGGALLNAQGKVIGVLGQISSPVTDDSYTYQDGSNPNEQQLERMRDNSFAVPIATAMRMEQQQAKSLDANAVVAKVNEIAQQTTVRIDTEQYGNGSGVIIARQASSYSVLTAAHVVRNPDRYTIVTPDGQQYVVNNNDITILPGVDLALVRFSSQKDYSVATLADYYIRFEEMPLVFVSGFPAVESGTPVRKLTAGTVIPPDGAFLGAQNNFSLGNGYQLVYSNISGRGMSGGPVFDSLGRVIGINAAAEAEWQIDDAGKDVEIQLGRSLGVPISTFLGYADRAKLNKQLLKLETTAPTTIDQTEANAIAQSLLTDKAPTDNASAFDWLNWGNKLWRVGKYAEAVSAFERAIRLKPDFYQAYYAMGRALSKQQKYKEALAAYDKSIEINSSIYELWRGKATAHESLEQYDAALMAYDKSIALNPDDSTLYLWRGMVLYKLGRYQEAEESYSRTIALNPSALAYGMRAETYHQLRDYQKAIADYDRTIAIQPNFFLNYHGRALLYAQMGNYQAALADANKAVELASNTYKPDAYQVRALIFIGMENFDGAIADATKTIDAQADEDTTVAGYQLRAMAYSRSGDRQNAIADYTEIVKIQPNNADVYHSRGNQRSSLEDYEGAIADYNKAIELAPESANYYASRGAVLGVMEDDAGMRNDYTKAIAIYTQQIAREPDKIELYQDRAIARAAIGDAEGVIEDVNKIKQLFTQQGSVLANSLELVESLPVQAYKRRAFSFFKLQEYQKAIADYNKAIELDPNDDSAYYFRASAREALKDYQGALADFNKAIEINPKKASYYNGRASVRNKLQDSQGALADYSKAIELDPNDEIAYYLRGYTRNGLQDYQGALADYNKAIELNPQNTYSYSSRGSVRANLQDYQGALADYNKAIELAPQNAYNYIDRAGVRTKLKDYQNALADYNKAIELQPDYAYSYYSRGLLYNELDNYQNAIADFTKTIELKPDTNLAEVYANRGYARALSNDYPAALEDANQAIALQPDAAFTYFVRGIVLHQKGDRNAALNDYQTALSKDENFVFAINNIGLLAYENGKIEDAIAQWQKALTINNQLAETKFAIAVALYSQGKRDEGLDMAKNAIALDNNLRDLNYLKKILWGDRLLNDAQNLLENLTV